ncbi:hypothetical protein PR048_022089 [Dryococelus australis]|uniref:PiggyBac transposable element-derived protein domain-containing protein n=1 Tax=Dryococelus australis TaxID=614101 RepID=A0ABQ9H003_9NEOP|nr:hypothetical protein PR048_022089 [Dryococelus australis]
MSDECNSDTECVQEDVTTDVCSRGKETASSDCSVEWLDLDSENINVSLYWCKKSAVHLSVKTITSECSAVDCIYKFFPKPIFSVVAREKNPYASQFHTQSRMEELSSHSRYKQWNECTAEDIMAMTAIEIGMGLCRKTSIEHKQHPKSNPQYDPLFKICPVVDIPGCNLSADETMLCFKVLWLKQYMPSKPSTKWGVKL